MTDLYRREPASGRFAPGGQGRSTAVLERPEPAPRRGSVRIEGLRQSALRRSCLGRAGAIAAMRPGQATDFLINGGEPITVYYEEQDAGGDRPRGEVTGDFEVAVGGRGAVDRVHVGPHSPSSSRAKAYASRLVADAVFRQSR